MTSKTETMGERLNPLRKSFYLGLAVAIPLIVFVAANADTSQASFYVYKNPDGCGSISAGADEVMCSSFHEAKLIAENLSWDFGSFSECVDSYGKANCYSDQSGAVKVRMAGFTQFSNTTRFGTILPVFRSSVHPGLYLPNAYPVLTGENSIRTNIMENGAAAAGRARSLGQELCVERKGVEKCGATHSFVVGSMIDGQTQLKLFSSKKP